MDATIPDTDVVRTIVDLACRAPSVHNSQPWHWRYEGGRLELHSDPARLLAAADPRGRQLLISCGAALGHLTVASTALRWRTHIDLLPDPARPHLVASIRFSRDARPRSHDFDLLAAIRRRRTDRTAFAPLPDNPILTELLRSAVGSDVVLTVLPADARPTLAEATALSSAARRYDSSYQAELHWWSGHSFDVEGIPESALATRAQRAKVPMGREFPDPHTRMGADDGPADASTVLVLSTPGDTAADWIRCGQALSAVALEATVQRLATCPLTHLTDIEASRDLIRVLAPRAGVPQLLVRVGVATHPAPLNDTPRRPVAQVLSFS
ncbi:NAD(P)H nitroreductase [Rhodococcus olei]|uniref:NAD(P)H nitroreductase n=1 Tax=Rhodococcus olei TaxID=2161675 RepID=A0ABP8PQD3_9NOCA